MALSIARVVLVPRCFSKSCPLVVRSASIIEQSGVRSSYARKAILDHNFTGIQVSDISHKNYQIPWLQSFSSTIQPGRVCWEGSSHSILLSKLEFSLKNHQVGEAWDAFHDFKSLYGFPKHTFVSRLIIELSYSSDPQWLQRAFDLVLLILKENSNLLHRDFLTKLSLSLARAQMPIPASTILRLMLENDKFPPMDLWRMVFLHMVKTEVGTYLASDIFVEICDCSLRFNAMNSKRARLIYPDTMIFNLVLDACVRFGSTSMGRQIMDLMPRIGVIADASSIVIISQILEMSGQRNELKKFKDHIDGVSILLLRHYRQFYDSLLSLHFKFNDIDAAAGLVLDMYRCRRSLSRTGELNPQDRKDLQNPRIVTIGSHNLKTGLRMQIMPELLQKDFVLKMESRPKFVMFSNGTLSLTNKALAKLIIGYRRDGRVGELSRLLLSIQKELGLSEEASLSSDFIDACIQLGWLETAHDILDDMESANTPVGSITYRLLLIAYCKGNMFREAKALLKQMRKVGLLVNLSDQKVISTCLEEVDINPIHTKGASSIGKSALAESLIREMKEEEKEMSSLVYEIDSSIYFFCKAKMMEDALETYRRMQGRKIQPTVQTFTSLVNGYSSLEMYREITILWGEIKRRIDCGDLIADRNLYEVLLWNFIRGGYFERVMEVIGYMKKKGMYTDKWKYKSEFLKFHKDLYRSLKASNAKTEAQSKRLEHVRAFRKWVGID